MRNLDVGDGHCVPWMHQTQYLGTSKPLPYLEQPVPRPPLAAESCPREARQLSQIGRMARKSRSPPPHSEPSIRPPPIRTLHRRWCDAFNLYREQVGVRDAAAYARHTGDAAQDRFVQSNTWGGT